MYITALVVIAIMILNRTYASRIYKLFHLDLLELWFHLNLMVLCLTLCYHLTNSTSSSDSVICKCTSASFATIFITFFGILGYHAHLQLQKTKGFMLIKHTLCDKWPIRQQRQIAAPTEDLLVLRDANSSKSKTPTTTMVDLREELLASDRDK